MLTFQQIIYTLTAFWEKRGCVIHQGHDLEVGAGTFNPATFLRCLGPEPYRTAYVEPSRRPKDGRYGDNPNRMQLFHQFQVILKPSPSDIQQLYLSSLQELGLDLRKHDIRFVHDDWESPTLGAWGLGWEVWCDGMEITQFTYFQAIGSLPLKPVSVEITYGLERLAMFIQNKESFYDMQWNDTLTFRDIVHRSEVEWSTYNFEEASTKMWLRHFADYEQEAKTLIARQLPLPAYDFVIKASHAFNMLDARGAISVTERTGYIARIRDLARLVAVEYCAVREKLGYPLLGKEKKRPLKQAPPLRKQGKFNPQKTQDFLLEIGSEELPATFVPIGCAHLEKVMRAFFLEQHLAFDALHIFGTPRRIAILVKGLAEGSADQETMRRGPSVSAAFDATGTLTPQGEGFLKGLGISHVTLQAITSGKIADLNIETIKGTDYLVTTLRQKGKSTLSLLAEHLPHLIARIEFPKKMRWGTLDTTYARPIHSIVALFGTRVIPFCYGDTVSGRTCFGHPQRNPKSISIKHPKEYKAQLKKHHVIVDSEERKAIILQQLAAFEKREKAQTLAHEKVLPQVLYLTEWPQLMAASFDAEFLKVPQEILISEMVEHQKYFPVADRSGRLRNLFLITADNTPNPLIRRGNQKVLSARLADGVFLYEQDLKTPLEAFNQKLKEMTYQKELGTMFEKVERIALIAQMVNHVLTLSSQTKVARAALLCKADLASSLVGEFPELQGTIGKHYALTQKEEKDVALAIEEHWMPRAEHAPLPASGTGIVLSLADKFDNLLSCYSTGLKPSSSSDPHALRRQTLGILKILIQEKKSVNLRELFIQASSLFHQGEGIVQEILTFITARAKSLFEDYGFKKDEIEACLQGLCIDPFDQFCKTQALHRFRQTGQEFAQLFEVYKRAKGQLERPVSTPFQPQLATEPAEQALIRALDTLHKHWKEVLGEKRYLDAFGMIARLRTPLAALFDTVKILSDDPIIRANRIALLQHVFTPFQELLDFSKIQEHT